ncbi:restriction endonuclease subunit S [Acinetobacter bereziniae]|uniref:restriction endonuclease subunit S n=1 Tax=Acinetobacter bereziniae TaxID=106648 RepID=UPI00125F40A7|nr:restriction endonuclease subunit S [Acinetobacter bereziniae]
MSQIGLPVGWVLANYADVYLSASNGTGGSQNKEGVGIPVSRIETIANETIDYSRIGYLAEYEESKVEKHKLNFGDILFSHINSPIHLGKTAIYDGLQPLYHGINLLRIVVDREVVLPEFFDAHCRYIRALGLFSLNAQHAVNQSSLNQKKLGSFELPLPPLAEQQIIIDKLDSLLAQVESIKTRLERIPEILKQFRQSVLAAAVSGKLTEEWRRINTNHVRQDIYFIDKYWENEYKKNNKKYKKIEYPKSDFDLSVFPDNWVKTNVGRVFDVYVGATPSRQREEFWNGEINWVSSSEVAFCRIRSTKENITNEGYKSTSTTIHPVGTVMLAMIGQGKTRGQAAILDIEACHNQNTAALRVPEKIANSEFLYFYLLYKYEETRQMGSGNNQQAMNKAIVQGLEFPLPPFEEQIEIVDKIESLFEYIERVERQVQVALDRVSNLTQSILAKAFRGELTAEWRETNPELISGEHSAEALLGRIKAERELAKPATKRGRGKA